MVNSLILYEGPSQLDGAPIVCVVTGLAKASANDKTGAMLQTWILRADMHPSEVLKRQLDGSICGDCPHSSRFAGSCYVRVANAPRAVWEAYRAGKYETWDGDASVFEGKTLRFGSYGDPAAVPLAVWNEVRATGLAGWTGYTHQWKRLAVREWGWLMASADTPLDGALARASGWRYFRVASDDALPLRTDSQGELGCLSVTKSVTCAACKLCSGKRTDRPDNRPDIVIAAHGANARRFRDWLKALAV